MIEIKERTVKNGVEVEASLDKETRIDLQELARVAALPVNGLMKLSPQLKKALFGGQRLVYRSASAVNLNVFQNAALEKRALFSLLAQLCNLVREMNVYKLYPGLLVLNPRYVYVTNDLRLQMLYVPLAQGGGYADLLRFAQSVVLAAKPASGADEEAFGRLMSFLRGQDYFDAESISQFIGREQRSASRMEASEPAILEPAPVQIFTRPEFSDVGDQTTMLGSNPFPEDYEDQGDGGGTISMHNPRLIRVSTQDTIIIDKPVFRIGSGSSEADCIISDNRFISRRHADIINREGRFFVRDLNSRNGTLINGSRLQANNDTEIFDGDTLCLADENFSFYL